MSALTLAALIGAIFFLPLLFCALVTFFGDGADEWEKFVNHKEQS